ncbi:unnamed protein product [Acanthoscelides obtectus]|uniref:Nuclease HARBI1 n=1 Tax=Acanthoscelides obtectus TaxID=200917 RepID=A0A9P0JWW9_ACAOB|nr:unnamed protein product [Acanthoscelides obtectus]CAK1657158.1 Putative nuclease HARBI1 [Acanthoscelides obtectus]
MPENGQERTVIRQEFFNIARFPRCIGALDCTHIKIKSPGGADPENYRNRKGFFSYNVQTTQNPYSVATVEIQDRQRHRAVAITSIAQESSASTSADLAETQENLTIAETHRQPRSEVKEKCLGYSEDNNIVQ